jgi:hypothetical protein
MERVLRTSFLGTVGMAQAVPPLFAQGDRHAVGGGRSWWAHFDFTRMNIDEPIVLRKKIEDVREAGAMLVGAAAFVES